MDTENLLKRVVVRLKDLLAENANSGENITPITHKFCIAK